MGDQEADPPKLGELPVQTAGVVNVPERRVETVFDPDRPKEEVWNASKETHFVRLDLARKIYWLVVGVVASIGFLSILALFSGYINGAPEEVSVLANDSAKFLAASLLPAVIGIFGSVIGFYFGREDSGPPKN